jgi:hypothetical protein
VRSARFLTLLLALSPVLAVTAGTGQAAATTPAGPATSGSTSAPSTLPMPPWWHGKQCDAGNYAGSHPLGADFFGLIACGPGPTQGGSDHLVDFFPGSWGEFEWECVELSMRWMYLAWGVNPYPANGDTVAANYAHYKAQFNRNGPDLVYVANGTKGDPPQPGDVLSYSEVHTSVVATTSINSAGNGSITVIEDNGGPRSDGWSTLPVTNWEVGWTVTGWLHDPNFTLPKLGYWLVSGDGTVAALGSAARLGPATAGTANLVTAASPTPDGRGLFAVTSGGKVTALGDAVPIAAKPSPPTSAGPIVGLATTPTGNGYWLLSDEGAVFPYGDALSYGSLPALGVKVSDIVGIIAAPGGNGYLLIGADGGVFCFGGARYHGSLPSIGVHVHNVRAVVPSPGEAGYLLVGSDGGVFSFGQGVQFFGSLPGEHIAVNDIIGIAQVTGGSGYWMAGADGTAYGLGTAKVFSTPVGSVHLPVAAIAAAAPAVIS